jgi:hypothetical protein
MKSTASIWIITAILTVALAAFPGRSFNDYSGCLKNFEWMIHTFSENDAGFQHVLNAKGDEAYRAHTETIRAKAATANEKTVCREILYEWLRFFRNGHIHISINDRPAQKKDPGLTEDRIREMYSHTEKVGLTEHELKQHLEGKVHRDPLEGIWQMGVYRVGIVGDENTPELLRAFIIEADGVYWTRGQVKSRFKKLPDSNEYETEFLMRDHTVRTGITRFLSYEGTIFSISDMGSLWVREYPEPKLSDLEKILVKAANSNEPFLERLGNETLYLRIPSFFGSEKERIDAVLSENDLLIRSTPNLIIDIRNGTGGSDMAYGNLIPYLYTNPIRHVGAQLLASEANARARDNDAEWAEGLGYADAAESFREQARLMRQNPGRFINPGRVMIGMETLDEVTRYPARVGILINQGNGSTDEQFLLEARQSFKVKIFGRPTKGVLDISNVTVATSPDGSFNLHYSMSKSLRLPGYPIDDIGIQPDFFLDHEIADKDWIAHVQHILEAN